MAGVELDALELVEVRSGGLHELDGAVDLGREALVLLVGGVLREALVPGVHLAEVRESALCEGADEIDGGCRGVVPLQQPLGVGGARRLGEVVAVDDVAAVGGQGHIAAGLGVARAGLGELPGHAAHLHDRHRRAVGEDDGHLQHGLDAVADLLGGGAGERLGAVAALQQERLPGRGAREPLAQVVHLAGEHQRRQGRELVRNGGDGIRVGPGRLLLDRERAPVIQVGVQGGHPLSLVARGNPRSPGCGDPDRRVGCRVGRASGAHPMPRIRPSRGPSRSRRRRRRTAARRGAAARP